MFVKKLLVLWKAKNYYGVSKKFCVPSIYLKFKTVKVLLKFVVNGTVKLTKE